MNLTKIQRGMALVRDAVDEASRSMTPEEYREFLAELMADVAIREEARADAQADTDEFKPE